MLRLVAVSREIAVCQSYFENRLSSSLPVRKQHMIGHLGMNYEVEIQTNGDLWFTSKLVGNPEPNRYWNAFGLINSNRSSDIIVEINIPLRSINRNVAGMYARDPQTNDIYLLHRGRVGGGRKGIGKRAFLEWYRINHPDWWLVINEGSGRTAEAIHVAHLSSETLLDDVKRFISHVCTFKQCAIDEKM